MNSELESKTRFRLEQIPEAPESLSSGAREHWDELIPIIFELKTARVCDIPALILMVEARADLNALQDTLRREGFTTESAAGSKKTHPAQRSLENARRQVETMLDRFGLIPGSFPRKAPDYQSYVEHWRRMHTDDDDDDDDEWENSDD